MTLLADNIKISIISNTFFFKKIFWKVVPYDKRNLTDVYYTHNRNAFQNTFVRKLADVHYTACSPINWNATLTYRLPTEIASLTDKRYKISPIQVVYHSTKQLNKVIFVTGLAVKSCPVNRRTPCILNLKQISKKQTGE